MCRYYIRHEHFLLLAARLLLCPLSVMAKSPERSIIISAHLLLALVSTGWRSMATLLPSVPSVLDGSLTARQESAIWQAVTGQPFAVAQPLTGYLLLSMSVWGRKRALSAHMAKALGISHKTWEAGLPKKPAKFRRSLESFDRYIHSTLAQTTPDCAQRRERALKRTVQSISEDPTLLPCTFFHQTLGIAGEDGLEMLAIRIDEISTSVLKQVTRQDEIPTLIVDAAVHAGEVPAGSVPVASHLDPGLDATLMLMARLDRDCAAKLFRDDDKISSLFGLLVDMSYPNSRRSARHRLLDLYYAMAIMAEGQSLPTTAPSIRNLEDTLLGGPPQSGGQSWIVRWRTKGKKIRLEDVEAIVAHVSEKSAKDVDHVFRLLWIMAQFWEVVELGGPEAVRRAGGRYRAWWDAMDSPGRKETLLSHPYWTHFKPHA
jgi:hypothetical protein